MTNKARHDSSSNCKPTQSEIQIKTQRINKHNWKFDRSQNRFLMLLKLGALMLPHFAAQVLIFTAARQNHLLACLELARLPCENETPFLHPSWSSYSARISLYRRNNDVHIIIDRSYANRDKMNNRLKSDMRQNSRSWIVKHLFIFVTHAWIVPRSPTLVCFKIWVTQWSNFPVYMFFFFLASSTGAILDRISHFK